MILRVLSDRFGPTQCHVAVRHSTAAPGGSRSSTASSRIYLVVQVAELLRAAPVAARHQPQVAGVGLGEVGEHVEHFDLHERQPPVERRRFQEVVAGQVRVPDHVPVPGFVVGTRAASQRADAQIPWVRRAVVQVAGTDLDVPADGVDDQRQHPGVVDQVKERLVMGERVADGEGVAKPQSLCTPHILAHLVDRRKQAVQLVRAEKVLQDYEPVLIEVGLVLFGHRHRHDFPRLTVRPGRMTRRGATRSISRQ